MGKAAFTAGPLIFYWYGLFLALSILAAMAITWYISIKQKQSVEVVLDLVLAGIPVSIFMARAAYVFANWSLYAEQPLEGLYIWQGGLEINGALVGLTLTLAAYTYWKKLSFGEWADRFAPGIVAGYVISRLGSIMTQESFGLPTELPWGIYIDFACRPAGYEQSDFFHPLFFYEASGGILLLGLLVAFIKFRKLPPGRLFLLVLAGYSAIALATAGVRFNHGAGGYLTAIGAFVITGVYFLVMKYFDRQQAAR